MIPFSMILPFLTSAHPALLALVTVLMWLVENRERFVGLGSTFFSRGRELVLRGRIIDTPYDTIWHMSQEAKAIFHHLSTRVSCTPSAQTVEALDVHEDNTRGASVLMCVPIQSSWVETGFAGVRARVSKCVKDQQGGGGNDAKGLKYVTHDVRITLRVRDFGAADAFMKECVKRYDAYLLKTTASQTCFTFVDAHEEDGPKFEAVPFECSKTFDNMVFPGKAELVRRIREFESPEGRARSDRIGKQHAMGMLFHGAPGCGKTSCIKAIANLTGRHIVVVRMDRVLADKAVDTLKAIMTRPSINGIKVPTERRLYVFEEADTWQGLLEARCSTAKPSASAAAGAPAPPNGAASSPSLLEQIVMSSVQQQHPKADGARHAALGALLELIDGIVEMPGRMCIMTTNHLDKLDPALLRPGRFGDVRIEFKRYTREEVAEMYRVWFERDLPLPVLAAVRDGAFSQADLGQLFTRLGPGHNSHDLMDVLCDDK